MLRRLLQVLFYNGARQDLQYRQFWCAVRPLHLLNRLQLVMSATQAAPVEEVCHDNILHNPAFILTNAAIHDDLFLTGAVCSMLLQVWLQKRLSWIHVQRISAYPWGANDAVDWVAGV